MRAMKRLLNNTNGISVCRTIVIRKLLVRTIQLISALQTYPKPRWVACVDCMYDKLRFNFFLILTNSPALRDDRFDLPVDFVNATEDALFVPLGEYGPFSNVTNIRLNDRSLCSGRWVQLRREDYCLHVLHIVLSSNGKLFLYGRVFKKKSGSLPLNVSCLLEYQVQLLQGFRLLIC